MKKILLSMLLLSTALAGKGQNLVPNGDFEQYSFCPTQFGQLDSALYWTTPSGGTSDYYNACANGGNADVPYNGFGYQNAHSGEGYSGICLYAAGNYRENLEVQLISPLIANTCYYFEMYVCSAEEINLATDTISIYFSNTLLYYPNSSNLPLTPQISSTTGFLSDTANWILISGNYTAAGGESFLLIGNFNDNNNSDTIWINTVGIWGNAAYVYVDDVSLSPCTGIEEQNHNDEIKIYPNPVKDELTVSSKQFGEKAEIKIYDMMGKEIYRDEIKTSNIKLQTSNYLSGIYFIEINTGKDIYRKKFIKE